MSVLQVSAGTLRLVGLAVVAVFAVAILYVTFRVGDAPDYEDDADDGVTSRGPAYGLSSLSHGLDSTVEVSEVLQIDDDSGRSASGGGDATSAAGSSDGGRDPSRTAGSKFTHKFRGERARGLLFEVTDSGNRSARFFVDDEVGDPTVTPASPADRRHGEEWLDEARSYLREMALEEVLSGRRERDEERERERETERER
jgi:hypothetical protein